MSHKIVYNHSSEEPLPVLDFLSAQDPNINWANEISSSKVRVFNYLLSEKYIVKKGDKIYYDPSYHHQEPDIKRDIELLYEDDYLYVVNKPAQMPVHPCGAYKQNTLTSILIDKGLNYHLVNRLDIETSGVVVLAKNKATVGQITKSYLTSQKTYITCIHGHFPYKLIAEGKLGPKTGSLVRKRKGFNNDEGKPSRTDFFLIKRGSGLSLLFAKPKTGRMHQIRAHLAENNFPVFGDKIYGKTETFFFKFLKTGLTEDLTKQIGFPRQFLHCWKNYYYHPILNKNLIFKASLPDELNTFVEENFK